MLVPKSRLSYLLCLFRVSVHVRSLASLARAQKLSLILKTKTVEGKTKFRPDLRLHRTGRKKKKTPREEIILIEIDDQCLEDARRPFTRQLN